MIGLLAHAAPINYKFPLPIWLYVRGRRRSRPALGAGGRVGGHRERRRPSIAGLTSTGSSAGSGPSLTVIGVALILVALAGGLFSTTDESQEFFENPVLVLTWVDFWVGLGIVSWLVGNVWERVSPLNVAGRALDRLLARNGVEPLALPGAARAVARGCAPARVVVDGADLGAGEGAAPARGDARSRT